MSNIKVLSIEERYEDKVFLLSDIEPFEQYQYFKIIDSKNKNPICKVVRPHGIGKLKDIDNQSILRNAESLGYDRNESFYWAEVLIERELTSSINPYAIAEKTTETETYDYLYSEDSKDKLILGEIRGTENVYSELEEDKYKDILMMCDDWHLKKQTCLPLIFDYKKLQQNPNIGIFGNSGSGKTFTLKSMIEEFIIHELPSIVFDPHNEFDFEENFPGLESKFIFNFKDRVEYFTAGKDFGLRFTDLTNEDFKRFIENTKTLSDPQSLAIDEIREQSETFEIFKNKISDISNALRKKEMRVKDEDITQKDTDLYNRYGSKISNSTVLVALNSKLSSYSKKNYFSKDYDGIINALKNKKTVIIRGEYNIVAPMMGIILNDLWKKRKDYKDNEIEEEYPPMITILDEAHLYAPKDNLIKAPLKQALIDISREGRKYGMFLVCATQRISELNNTVLSQMSTRLILKTCQESDKLIVQRECGLSEAENSRLHLLDSGHGYMISPILKTKTAIAFKSRSNYSKPKNTINVFDELKTLKLADTKKNLEEYLMLQLPLKITDLNAISRNYRMYSGEQKTLKEIRDVLSIMEEKEKIINKENTFFIL